MKCYIKVESSDDEYSDNEIPLPTSGYSEQNSSESHKPEHTDQQLNTPIADLSKSSGYVLLLITVPSNIEFKSTLSPFYRCYPGVITVIWAISGIN